MSQCGQQREDSLTTIHLTNEDAELFKWFRKYQKIWERARDLKPGSLTLHFDKHGSINKNEFHFYSRA